MENAIHEDTTEIAGVEGEVLEQVVQPEVVGEAPVDMQAQEEPNVDDAKKFQSMYDNKAADYDKLNNDVEMRDVGNGLISYLSDEWIIIEDLFVNYDE